MNESKKMTSSVSEEDFGINEDVSLSSVKKSGSVLVKLSVVFLIVIVLVFGLFLVSKYTSWNVFGLTNTEKMNDNWDAVFLTNGQVYFGHIVKQTRDIIEMENIYYLQVTRQLQPTPNNQASNQEEQQQLSLVKLGDELHGPTDYMNINRSQVLFTEKLKDDSKVVDAIKRYIEDEANNK